MAQPKPEAVCDLCGFSIYSRTHMEGRGGIHDAAGSLASLSNRELAALLSERGLPIPIPPNKANLIEALTR